MNIVTLNNAGKSEQLVHLNKDQHTIEFMVRHESKTDGDHTQVSFTNGKTYYVTQTPEKILEIFND